MLAAALLALAPSLSAAQSATAAGDSTASARATCISDSGWTLPSAYQGRRIGSLRVVTTAPPPIPGVPDAIDNLHVRTREATIRRHLLFSPGDEVDTLQVAESLRRLRRLRYLSDVGIVATSCAAGAPVDVAVVTRDAWSTAASVKVRSAGSALIGLEERNVLGTGRDAKVYLRSDGAQLAFGLGYTDPWVAGTNVAASVARNVYRDGGDWTAGAGIRERSVFDRWRAELNLARSARAAPALVGDTVRRETAALLVGRRVSRSMATATSLLVGAEYGEARVAAGSSAAIVGPSAVRREFIGLDVGIARRAASYRVVSWYLPGRIPLELPVILEGEAVLGVGRDLAFGRPALHADAWVGRFWVPGDRLILSADAWGSGYRIGQQWSAGSVRLALGADGPASRGRWVARVSAEQLSDPDPDVRALASADPTLPALPFRARLAETAVALSVERGVDLRRVGHSYMLGLAAIGGASMRWDPAASDQRPTVGTLALGLRLLPARAGLARIGIDVGVPLLRSGGVSPRPFVAVNVSPWLEAGRVRDGRRTR